MSPVSFCTVHANNTVNIFSSADFTLIKTYQLKHKFVKVVADYSQSMILYYTTQNKDFKVMRVDLSNNIEQNLVTLYDTSMIAAESFHNIVPIDNNSLIFNLNAFVFKLDPEGLSLYRCDKIVTQITYDVRSGVFAYGQFNGALGIIKTLPAVFQRIKTHTKFPSYVSVRKLDENITTLHWHHTSVTSLSFIAGTPVLISGAGEGCLVEWNVLTTEKRIIPRVGGPIKLVITPFNAHHPWNAALRGSTDKDRLTRIASMSSHMGDRILILTETNAIQLISLATHNFKLSYDGLVYNETPWSAPNSMKPAIWNNYFIESSLPGSLQFYPIGRQQGFTLNVLNRDLVPTPKGSTELILPPTVLRVVAAKNYIATVDGPQREYKHRAQDCNIKLWACEKNNCQSVLELSSPFTDATVPEVYISPDESLVITYTKASNKVILLTKNQKGTWFVFGSIMLKEPPTSVITDADSSMILVATRKTVTFYDLSLNSVASFTPRSTAALSKQFVTSNIAFVPNSYYLLCIDETSSSSTLVVDLRSMKIFAECLLDDYKILDIQVTEDDVNIICNKKSHINISRLNLEKKSFEVIGELTINKGEHIEGTCFKDTSYFLLTREQGIGRSIYSNDKYAEEVASPPAIINHLQWMGDSISRDINLVSTDEMFKKSAAAVNRVETKNDARNSFIQSLDMPSYALPNVQRLAESLIGDLFPAISGI